MGYTDDSTKVRATYYKMSGKYYTEEPLDMSGRYDDVTAVAAVENARGDRLPEMWCVVRKPYHRQSYPVMLPPIVRYHYPHDMAIAEGVLREFETQYAFRPEILWAAGPPYPGRVVLTWDQFVYLAWHRPERP